MAPPIPIPTDVHEWLKGVFAACNERVSGTMTQVPTTYELSLDMTFIQHFLTVSAPHRLRSGWTAEISTHFLGGGRHYGEWGDWPRRWEIADIGLLVAFRHGGKLLRSKVALLQSKRLYPNEQELEEDNPIDYVVGFGRLLHSDDDWTAITEPRSFGFTEDSRYKALLTGTPQYHAIASYETQKNIPVYYLLYNPLQIPSSAIMPLTGERLLTNDRCDVGCRVVPATQLRSALRKNPDGHSPAYGELRCHSAPRFCPTCMRQAGDLSTSSPTCCLSVRPATSPRADPIKA